MRSIRGEALEMNPFVNKNEGTEVSRRSLLKLTATVSAAALTGQFRQAWAEAPQAAKNGGNAKATFTNPLFAGDYSDPTILRVGQDFYMTHTSYSYAPGLIVWHSRDLVNWLPIAHVVKETHGEIWAPDLVEHDGRYYIYFPMGGLYVVHAENPHGPWSAPINLNLGGIDPGHVVGPDGTRYLHFAGGKAIELSADGLSTVGEEKKVYDGWSFPADWKTEGVWLESPKLTRRGEYYYLTCAEGGTAGPATSHMAVVARSKSPLGPWENSPLNPLIHTYSAEEQWFPRPTIAGILSITAIARAFRRWVAIPCSSRWSGPRTAGRLRRWERVAAIRCRRRWACSSAR
jgi:beta-xylosidase